MDADLQPIIAELDDGELNALADAKKSPAGAEPVLTLNRLQLGA